MSRRWDVARVPVLLTAIFLAGIGAIHVAPAGSNTASWWPAAGLASVLVIGAPRRTWPQVLALVVLVTGTANLVSGREPVVAAMFAVANATEALTVALLLGAHRRRPALRTATDLARLCVAALAGAAVIGLLAGVTIAEVAGGDLWTTARNVLSSHLASQLLILPVALAGADLATGRSRRAHLLGTGAGAVTLAAFVGVFVWGHLPALAFLPLPALVWAALLLPRRHAFGLLLVVGSVISVATAQDVGPLAIDADLGPATVGALAQLYLVVLFFVAVPLVLVVDQRTSALAVATAVRDSTTANAIIGIDPGGRIRFFNVGAERMLGWTAAEVVGGRPSELYVSPEAVAEHNDRLGIGAGLVGLRQEDAVERIHRNDRRLLMLIEDLLTLTAAESRATGRHDEVLAADVLAEVARQTDDVVGGRDLGLRFCDDTAGATVLGDRDQLERALLNLGGNAVKFTPSGGRVEVTARTEGDELVWTVRDTGIGIPDGEADHLFQRFFRARDVVQAAIPGTGLGLSIVRTIAEAHGGTANRVPHEGPGTSFELRLPLASPIPTSAQVTSVEVPT